MSAPREIKSGEPGHDHCRIDDGLEQPSFHHLERLGLLRSDRRLAMIDEQPRQIEHAGHPRDDRNDGQRFDPFVHASDLTGTSALASALPTFRYPFEPRLVRKQAFPKTKLGILKFESR